jgi:hypothetical protein
MVEELHQQIPAIFEVMVEAASRHTQSLRETIDFDGSDALFDEAAPRGVDPGFRDDFWRSSNHRHPLEI